MRKYKSSYLKPYIRKLKKGDRSNRLHISIKLGILKQFEQHIYVLVQRGSNNVIMAETSKQEIKRRIFGIRSNKKFNIWCNNIKNKVQNL